MADEKKAVPVLESPEYKKLLAETEKLAKANEKLTKEVENKKTALKGKQTEITKLRRELKGSGKMHIRQH
jgi:predicted  nucleic acid-binding Zn-ribbon protein